MVIYSFRLTYIYIIYLHMYLLFFSVHGLLHLPRTVYLPLSFSTHSLPKQCPIIVKNQQQDDLNMVDAGKPDPFLYGWAFASFSETFAVVLSTECDATIRGVVSSAPESMMQNTKHRLAKIYNDQNYLSIETHIIHKTGIFIYLHENHQNQPSM